MPRIRIDPLALDKMRRYGKAKNVEQMRAELVKDGTPGADTMDNEMVRASVLGTLQYFAEHHLNGDEHGA